MSGSDSVLITRARDSANIQPAAVLTSRQQAPPPATSGSSTATVERSNGSKKKKRSHDKSRDEDSRSCKRKMVNSQMFPKSERPPWLQNDEVFDCLTMEAATMQISQWTMTRTMQEQNKLKEEKTVGGKMKSDQEVKTVAIESGEDDAKFNLHPKRFCFRTPLVEPASYWKLYPIKWPEMTRNVNLEHLGLDHVLSPKTLELLNDRRSIITIKMFAGVNVDVGKDQTKVSQKVKQSSDGSTVIQARDDWLDMASVAQIMEALDNLVRVWAVYWPGEFGPNNLRGVISKYRGFGDLQDNSNRKNVLESFINRVLSVNASRAGSNKPPLAYKNIDSMAWDIVGRVPSRKADQDDSDVINHDKKNGDRKKREFEDLKKYIKDKKHNGKSICIWYNTTFGCKNTSCGREHACGFIPKGKSEPCCGSHSKTSCPKKTK